jgi:hypothetical protein
MSLQDQLSARFEALAVYTIAGERAHSDFIALIKSRIEAEEHSAKALAKLGNSPWTASASGTLFEGTFWYCVAAMSGAGEWTPVALDVAMWPRSYRLFESLECLAGIHARAVARQL